LCLACQAGKCFEKASASLLASVLFQNKSSIRAVNQPHVLSFFLSVNILVIRG
jgi:hypothetical protein